VQHVHARGYLHRDIKPENFLIGMGKNEGLVYLIDYGLATKYLKRTTGEHVPYEEHKKFVGAARYASLNAHARMAQGRKDDLEALGFVLLFMLKGSLPWQGLEPQKSEALESAIYKAKLQTSIADLCQDLPGICYPPQGNR
jgi:serine/threonine protein kinase